MDKDRLQLDIQTSIDLGLLYYFLLFLYIHYCHHSKHSLMSVFLLKDSHVIGNIKSMKVSCQLPLTFLYSYTTHTFNMKTGALLCLRSEY